MAGDNRAVSFLVARLQSESDQAFSREQRHIADVASVVGHMKASLIYRLFGGYSNVDQARDFAKDIEANTR